jgi:outer membrane protein assembly factor BamD
MNGRITRVHGAMLWVKMVLVWTLVLLLFACAGSKKAGFKTVEGDPEKLYKEGLSLFNKRLYPEALKKFEEIKSSFPDSPPYTVWAELKAADCYFLDESYVEAVAAYEEFRKTHPAHDEIPYVQYQIGMCYYRQMLTLDRDQASTRRALSSFEYLIANYPPSLFTEKAKEKVEVCKNRLADHEFYVGDFYYRHSKYLGAIRRFQGMVDQYPDSPDIDKGLFFLGRSSALAGQIEKAEAAFAKLLKEHPGSPYSKDARAMLERGLEIKEVPKGKGSTSGAGGQGSQMGKEGPQVTLTRFEDEGRKVVPPEQMNAVVAKVEGEGQTVPPVVGEPARPEMVAKEPPPLIPPEPKKEQEVQSEALQIAFSPQAEIRQTVAPTSSPRVEAQPEEEPRMAALPSPPTVPPQEVNPGKAMPEGTKRAKLGEFGEPIDITSDLVEADAKENRIVFKGNVTARQRDVVIYADSLEAVIGEDGKAIEKVIAGGNVKIQQGLRVASCQKAIFYNLEKRVVLTGDPKVWEGENMVSGEEIIVDVEGNRVEVKGGMGGRGKAKIQP